MELKYVYIKQRSEFGKQCFFEDVGPNVEENIFPDPDHGEDYVRQFLVNKSTQKSTQFALHEVQTVARKSRNSAVLHLVGSWPREINPFDEETVRRFCRRVTRSDNWIASMWKLMGKMEYHIKQNNTVNIHDYYFDDMVPTELKSSPKFRVVNMFSDQESIVRPVNNVSWSMSTNQLAAAYCFKNRTDLPSHLSPDAYIWDVEISNKPLMILKSISASMVVEFNPRDPSLLMSGLMSGQVCSWDTRTGDSPVQISEALYSHRNPVNQALWIASKTNTEFFSASNSGTIKWWDTRKMRIPTEILVMDLEEPDREDINSAIGVSALQYESTMGSRFLVGLENGTVVNVNRKAATPQEKLYTRFYCHYSPILSVDRNPGSMKHFLTVGDWHTKVWTEETKENCLIRTTRRGITNPTGGCWSRSRLSLFFTIDTEGRLDAYDILQGTSAPLDEIRLCEKALTTIKPHDDGQLLAVGGSDGNIYIIQCEGLLSTTYTNDKQFYATCMDGCTRYEKSADARQKEIRMIVAQTPFKLKSEVAPVAKTKRDKSKDLKERKKAKEAERDKAKDKDTPRKSRLKKSIYRDTPFSNDTTIMEAEKLYFINLETERDSFESEDTDDIERLYKLHRKAEEEELAAKAAENDEENARAMEEKSRRLRRLRRPRPPRTTQSPGMRFKASDSIEKMGALLEAETVKSEEGITGDGGRKRRASSEIPLKICPRGVCKPEICCLDVVKARKEKRELERLKELKKEKKMKPFLEPLDEERLRQKLVPFREWQKWQSKIAEVKRKIPERTPLQKKRILLGKDAPPNILVQDVKDAKKYLKAWNEGFLSAKSSLYRSQSASPKRRIREEDDERRVKKKAISVQDLTSTSPRSPFDDLTKISARIAEVKTKMAVPKDDTLQLKPKTIVKREEHMYPRISEAYFPKYPE
ncbi:hypothetical protein KPH14_008861 [Odynerus spinipes]|uniref:Dynein intermediate chain 3, ciliary n=1 Tax=Odynerus spinipes TaxID=1348599 RepID=A0AAD9R8M6_9HYME|nr:hypothetical protein KPH14_008861 [Odynerus spinipes]